jgi:hypothetical protein
LLAGRPTAIEDFEDRVKLVQREADGEGLSDHPHSLQRVYWILAITIASPP